MHVQPGSRGRRTPLSVEEHARLRRAARHGSLVATRAQYWARERLDLRVDELDLLEAQGYVHVGERAWLDEVRAVPSAERGTALGYADWVRQALDDLGLRWAVDDAPDGRVVTAAWADGLAVWAAELDASDLGLGFADLDHPGFLPADEEFVVRVAGSASGPSPAHLVTAFEALHDLEYAVARLVHPAGYEASSVVGVEATNAVEPGRWTLLTVSEHGADVDYTIPADR